VEEVREVGGRSICVLALPRLLQLPLDDESGVPEGTCQHHSRRSPSVLYVLPGTWLGAIRQLEIAASSSQMANMVSRNAGSCRQACDGPTVAQGM
jgi:hypothetical protein